MVSNVSTTGTLIYYFSLWLQGLKDFMCQTIFVKRSVPIDSPAAQNKDLGAIDMGLNPGLITSELSGIGRVM